MDIKENLMIKLKFTGMCEDCQCADLKLEEMNLFADNQSRKEWSAKCIHEGACLRMLSQKIEEKEI